MCILSSPSHTHISSPMGHSPSKPQYPLPTTTTDGLASPSPVSSTLGRRPRSFMFDNYLTTNDDSPVTLIDSMRTPSVPSTNSSNYQFKWIAGRRHIEHVAYMLPNDPEELDR